MYILTMQEVISMQTIITIIIPYILSLKVRKPKNLNEIFEQKELKKNSRETIGGLSDHFKTLYTPL